MVTEACAYVTDRFRVAPWHELEGYRRGEPDLAQIVAQLLTEPVTRTLPAGWQGPYSTERAAAWIYDRDHEGTTLLVRDLASAEPLGLVLLGEEPVEPTGVVVRLGYLVAQPAWGQGIATEILAGFVEWCRSRPEVRAIVAGVSADHARSRRVLDKLGFAVVDEGRRDASGRDAGVLVLALDLARSRLTSSAVQPDAP